MDVTEEKIINAAKLLFLRHGYTRTTTSAVSDHAGLNKSLIHYYFRTKKALYLKIIRMVVNNELIPILERIKKSDSLEAQLRYLYQLREILSYQYPQLPLILLNREDPGHKELFTAIRDNSISLNSFRKHIIEQSLTLPVDKSETGFFLLSVLLTFLFTNLFKDAMNAWLNHSDSEYEKLLEQFYQKLFKKE